MARLVTIDQAARHLLLPIDLTTTPADDPQLLDLGDTLDDAQDIILGYLKTWPATWVDPDTTPRRIQRAILLQLGELWRFRGDDPQGQGAEQDLEVGQLSPTITNLLRRDRDPALA